MTTPRYLKEVVQRDLSRKMVFLSGPRQVGKTTLAESILKEFGGEYLNWDFDADRRQILSGEWPAECPLLVFDEIHKYRRWRNLLKGLYDKKRHSMKFLVTGSGRLDYYRYSGDSLQGRYFHHRMHPLSVAELGIRHPSEFDQLLKLGGFPEPFFSGSLEVRNRWANQYQASLVREDMRELEQVVDVGRIEQLVWRLPQLVGAPLSLNALREDLQVAHATVSKWCTILERLYSIFRLAPFGAPKIRAVKKEQKHYHFDWSQVEGAGQRLENLVACHLLKWVQFQYDSHGRNIELRYFRDTDKREVDFVVTEGTKPIWFIETKSNDISVSPHLKYLKERFPKVPAVQLVTRPDFHRVDGHGIEIESVISFLGKLV